MTTPFIEFIHPEDRNLVMKEYHERISGVKKTSRYNLRLLTKTGDIKWAIIHSILFEWEGKPVSLTMLTDITEQKETEAALSESEAHLRAFIHSTEDMICARDREGGLISWNEAFNTTCKTHFGVEAHVGLKTVDLIPPEQEEKIQHIRTLWRRVCEGERIHERFSYTWPNGEDHFYEASWSPIIIGDEIAGAAAPTRTGRCRLQTH